MSINNYIIFAKESILDAHVNLGWGGLVVDIYIYIYIYNIYQQLSDKRKITEFMTFCG
jgi:hypothetical protein